MFWPFHRHRVSFRRPKEDGFHLDTKDVDEGPSFFGIRLRRRNQFSRYISAGGTRNTRHSQGIEQLLALSRYRFSMTVVILVIVWLLGTFL